MTRQYDLVPTKQVVALTCDRCGKTHDDVMDRQEYLSWSDTCGYNNTAFGDMMHVSIDLCQHCVKEVLGPWIKITNQWVDPAEFEQMLAAHAED